MILACASQTQGFRSAKSPNRSVGSGSGCPSPQRTWAENGFVSNAFAPCADSRLLLPAVFSHREIMRSKGIPRFVHIEGCGGVLAATQGVFLKLGLSFGGDGNHFHASRLGTRGHRVRCFPPPGFVTGGSRARYLGPRPARLATAGSRRTAETRFSPSSGSRASSSAMVWLLSGCRSCGRNLGQRRQHKAALGQGRVRQRQLLSGDDPIPHQQQIEIQRAGTVQGTLAAIASQLPFDGQQSHATTVAAPIASPEPRPRSGRQADRDSQRARFRTARSAPPPGRGGPDDPAAEDSASAGCLDWSRAQCRP